MDQRVATSLATRRGTAHAAVTRRVAEMAVGPLAPTVLAVEVTAERILVEVLHAEDVTAWKAALHTEAPIEPERTWYGGERITLALTVDLDGITVRVEHSERSA